MDQEITGNATRKMKKSVKLLMMALGAGATVCLAIFTIPDLWSVRLSLINAFSGDNIGASANAVEHELKQAGTDDERARILVWFSVHHDNSRIHESERIIDMVWQFQIRKAYRAQLEGLLNSKEGADLSPSVRSSLQTYLETVSEHK
jgi:hypothetical protein